MRSRVLSEILLGKEIFSAESALVRLHLQVDSLPVVDEGRVGLESGTAFWTEEGFDVGVDRTFVNLPG